MANLVNQPDARPTNKLTAAVVVAALAALARWALPALDDDALWVGLTPLAILVVGWFIRDKVNV